MQICKFLSRIGELYNNNAHKLTLFDVEIILYEEYCYQLSLQDGDMTMEYLSIRQVAEKWGLSARRITVLCSEGRIEGATKIGSYWAVPADAVKPKDERIKSGKYVKERTEKHDDN